MKLYTAKEVKEITGVNPDIQVKSPNKVAEIAKKLLFRYNMRKQEAFAILCLDGANQIIGKRILTIGLVNQCQIHPREAFRYAIQKASASVIFVHNHPSGNVNPSNQDIEITGRLVEAGELLGINVLDHIIVSKTNFSSLKQLGKI